MCIKKVQKTQTSLHGKLISYLSSVFRFYKCHVKWVCGRMAVNKSSEASYTTFSSVQSHSDPRLFLPVSELLPVLNYYLISYSRGGVSAVSCFINLGKSPFLSLSMTAPSLPPLCLILLVKPCQQQGCRPLCCIYPCH